MRGMTVWMNGMLVCADTARVSVFDRGLLYGDGVFETMRAYGGAVFMLDAHLDRLAASLAVAHIALPYTKEGLAKALGKTVGANRLGDASIRLTVTRGVGRFGIGTSARMRPTVIIVAKPFQGYPARRYTGGISARVVAIRQNDQSPLAHIKSLNYMNAILARYEAEGKGADEAIMLNTRGHIAEAATSTVFLVSRGALITPPLDSGILPGITREVVIALARRARISVSEEIVRPGALRAADEVFLANSLAEILPVTKIDGRRIGAGRPGPLTQLLHALYVDQVVSGI